MSKTARVNLKGLMLSGLVAVFAISCLWFTLPGRDSPLLISSAGSSVPEVSGTWLDLDFSGMEFDGGAGISSDPYKIATADQLALLSYLVHQSNSFIHTQTGENSAHYRSAYYNITNHISLAGRQWVPVGTLANPFSGFISGANSTNVNGSGSPLMADLGITIADLTIVDTEAYPAGYVGFLGYVKNDGPMTGIYRVGFHNVYIDVEADYVGAVAGAMVGDNTTISNFHSGQPSVGPLTPFTASAGINETYVTGNISGNNFVGGLVGALYDGASVFNNYNHADITAKQNNATVGGIVGLAGFSGTTNMNELIVIRNNYSIANITRTGSQAFNIGGIVGDVAQWSTDEALLTIVPANNHYYSDGLGAQFFNANPYGDGNNLDNLRNRNNYVVGGWSFRTPPYMDDHWSTNDINFIWKIVGNFNSGYPMLNNVYPMLCVDAESDDNTMGSVQFEEGGKNKAPVIEGTNYFLMGDEISITATASNADKYKFKEWKAYDAAGNPILPANQIQEFLFKEPFFNFQAARSIRLVAHFELIDYFLNYMSGDTSRGTIDVTRNGSPAANDSDINYDDTLVFTPTAKLGSTFNKWRVNGYDLDEPENEGLDYSLDPTTKVLTIEVTGHTIVYASFVLLSNTVTFVADPGAVITGTDGEYAYNHELTFSVNIDTNYVFYGWRITLAGNGADYDFIMPSESDPTHESTWYVTESVIIRAICGPESVLVTVGVYGGNPTVGSVSGGGSKEYNSTVEVVATPAGGYYFDYWIIDDIPMILFKNPTYSFTVTSDISLVAVFALQQIQVTVAAGTGGTAEIVEAGTGGTEYFAGFNQQITIKATPGAGYVFVRWEGSDGSVYNGAEQAEKLITIIDDITFTAVFTERKETLAIVRDDEKFGVITGIVGGIIGQTNEDGIYIHGEEVTLNISVNNGYEFLGLFNGGTLLTKNMAYVFDIYSDLVLTAKFQLLQRTLTFVAENAAHGTVEASRSPVTGSYYYFYDVIGLSPVANHGYVFDGWYVNGAPVSATLGSVLVVEITDNFTVVAKFRLASFAVAIVKNIDAAGLIAGQTADGLYTYNATYSFTANAYHSYRFAGWYIGEDLLSSEATLEFLIEDDTEIEAKFVKQFYVSLELILADSANLSGEDFYDEGVMVVISAANNPGYRFVRWSSSGLADDMVNALHAFELTGDIMFTAHLIKQAHITVNMTNTNFGSVTGSGDYDIGQTVTLTATPANLYNFVGWQINGVIVSDAREHTFAASGDLVVIALFEQDVNWMVVIIVASSVLAAGIIAFAAVWFTQNKKGYKRRAALASRKSRNSVDINSFGSTDDRKTH
ncbi:MAG: InlB B-repeat-containing protein [Firmicutes bacterium]|nr:InlB B-repeat-containing protein [Bacillota bacterium]